MATSSKPKVYIETSVVSYLTASGSRDLVMAANQQITNEWWKRRGRFELVTSQLVVDEASRGNSTAAKQRLDVLRDLNELRITAESGQLAQTLVDSHSLPESAFEDALHIAIAAIHGIDYLLTWNCKHIANAELSGRIRSTVESYGCGCPIICVPSELMGELHDEP